MHLDDLLCCKFNSPWCFYLSVFLLLEFYSGLILFCGLKDRLNQYLQHKKLNLTYCVKSISGPEAYIQGPDRRGKHGASWSHQSVRKCVFAEYTRERAVARLYVWNAFFLLIGISSIHSDRVILAMKDYLVGGTPVRRSARNTRWIMGISVQQWGDLYGWMLLQQGLHLIIQMSHRHLTKLWHSGVSGR